MNRSHLIAAALAGLALVAGGPAAAQAPAELPPAGYSAGAYVDSRGCAFIRVDVGGATDWAPRLNANRQQLCGLEPTFAAAAPAPSVAPSAPRVRASAPPPVAVARPVIRVEVVLPPGTDPSTVRVRCPSVLSPTTCTVEPLQPAAVTHGTRSPVPRDTHTPVARLHVDRPGVPAGYRVTWDDGRLNPYRGIRTVEGNAQTRMVWTDTVPRRLVPAD